MKKFYVFLLFVVALTYQTSFYIQANENNLIGTLSILKPEFYPISPLHGAVAWQQEWVMRLYDLGWDRDKSTGKLIIADEQPPALIRIIDRLFHRPPGTSGMMNFSPTKDIRDQASVDVAQSLGKIIALLPEFGSKEVGSKSNRLKELAEQLKASSKIEKIKSTASSLCNVSDADFFGKLAESKKALQNVKIPEKAVSAAEFKKLINEFCEFKENCAKLVRGADTAQLLRQAFSQNPQETLLMLLALIWSCCESSRDDLANYYQALDEKIREVRNMSIFSKDQEPGWQAWAADKFVSETEGKMKADLQAFEGKFENSPQLYEALTYIVLMPGKYPKLSEYKTATLWFDGMEHRNVTFADCMDSSMMNFLLILAYDKDARAFGLEFLKSKLELQKLNEKLERFLNSDHPAFIRKIEGKEDSKINLTPQTVEEIEIHNAWTDVESNIPGVAYNKCLRNNTIESCRGESRGFIVAVPELKDAPKFQKAGYVIVAPAEGICFELQPSLKNFIVLLNYLLNLGLFNPVNVYDELLKPDFVKTYLPKLAEKLNLKIEPSISLDEIDSKDYGEQMLTKLGFDDEFPFDLSTSYGHGEIISNYRAAVKELKNAFDRLPNTPDLLPSARGIKLGNMDRKDIVRSAFTSNKVLNFYDFPWFDVSTSHTIINILRGIKIVHAQCSPEIQGYFMRLAEIQADLTIRINLFEYVVLFLENLSEKYVNTISTTASISINNNREDIQDSAMRIFKVLFERGQGYPAAIVAASKGITNADVGVRWISIQLFEELVKNGHGYTEAIAGASKAGGDDDPNIRWFSTQVFKELVKNGKGYPEAIAAASKGAKDTTDCNVQISAIGLFAELVKNGQGYTEAISTASECVKATEDDVRRSAINLFKALVEKREIPEGKMSETIKRMQDKAESRKFFDSIKGKLKDAKIKADLEQCFGQQ